MAFFYISGFSCSAKYVRQTIPHLIVIAVLFVFLNQAAYAGWTFTPILNSYGCGDNAALQADLNAQLAALGGLNFPDKASCDTVRTMVAGISETEGICTYFYTVGACTGSNNSFSDLGGNGITSGAGGLVNDFGISRLAGLEQGQATFTSHATRANKQWMEEAMSRQTAIAPLRPTPVPKTTLDYERNYLKKTAPKAACAGVSGPCIGSLDKKPDLNQLGRQETPAKKSPGGPHIAEPKVPLPKKTERYSTTQNFQQERIQAEDATKARGGADKLNLDGMFKWGTKLVADSATGKILSGMGVKEMGGKVSAEYEAAGMNAGNALKLVSIATSGDPLKQTGVEGQKIAQKWAISSLMIPNLAAIAAKARDGIKAVTDTVVVNTFGKVCGDLSKIGIHCDGKAIAERAISGVKSGSAKACELFSNCKD